MGRGHAPGRQHQMPFLPPDQKFCLKTALELCPQQPPSSLYFSLSLVTSFGPAPSKALHKTDFYIYCGLFLCFLRGNTFIVCSIH